MLGYVNMIYISPGSYSRPVMHTERERESNS